MLRRYQLPQLSYFQTDYRASTYKAIAGAIKHEKEEVNIILCYTDSQAWHTHIYLELMGVSSILHNTLPTSLQKGVAHVIPIRLFNSSVYVWIKEMGVLPYFYMLGMCPTTMEKRNYSVVSNLYRVERLLCGVKKLFKRIVYFSTPPVCVTLAGYWSAADAFMRINKGDDSYPEEHHLMHSNFAYEYGTTKESLYIRAIRDESLHNEYIGKYVYSVRDSHHESLLFLYSHIEDNPFMRGAAYISLLQGVVEHILRYKKGLHILLTPLRCFPSGVKYKRISMQTAPPFYYASHEPLAIADARHLAILQTLGHGAIVYLPAEIYNKHKETVHAYISNNSIVKDALFYDCTLFKEGLEDCPYPIMRVIPCSSIGEAKYVLSSYCRPREKWCNYLLDE